jgi:hypothetical protein
MYWNPAGLAWQEGLGVTHYRHDFAGPLQFDMFYKYQAVTFARRRMAAGIWRTYYSYGAWEATDPEGQSLGTFESYERAWGLALAWSPEPHVAVALGGKLVKEVLVPERLSDLEEGLGDTWAVDAGILARTPLDLVRAGLALQNFGPDLRFEAARQSAPLPRHARLSVAVSPLAAIAPLAPTMEERIGLPAGFWKDRPLDVIVVGEINKSLVGRNWYSVATPGFWRSGHGRTTHRGIELRLAGIFSLRHGHFADPDEHREGATRGWGVTLPANDFVRLSADFATLPGDEERWTVSLGAGPRLLGGRAGR